MRVRSGRNNQVVSRDETGSGSGSVTLSFDPEVFNADQALGFQPRVGQTLLQCWGSGHVPIAVATDSMLERGLQIVAQALRKRSGAPELLVPLPRAFIGGTMCRSQGRSRLADAASAYDPGIEPAGCIP